jgi:hypothetical protein
VKRRGYSSYVQDLVRQFRKTDLDSPLMSISNSSATWQPVHPIVPPFPSLGRVRRRPFCHLCRENPARGRAPVPLSRFGGQAGVATNVTASPLARRSALTTQQASVLTLTDAEILQYYLMVGDIELAPAQTEPATRALRADIRAAFQSTSPSLEAIKATGSRALIAGATGRPGGSGCRFPPV